MIKLEMKCFMIKELMFEYLNIYSFTESFSQIFDDGSADFRKIRKPAGFFLMGHFYIFERNS